MELTLQDVGHGRPLEASQDQPATRLHSLHLSFPAVHWLCSQDPAQGTGAGQLAIPALCLLSPPLQATRPTYTDNAQLLLSTSCPLPTPTVHTATGYFWVEKPFLPLFSVLGSNCTKRSHTEPSFLALMPAALSLAACHFPTQLPSSSG